MNTKRLISFFWKSDLSADRMLEIQTWVDSLAPADYAKLQDLLRDQRDSEAYDVETSHYNGDSLA